jgi:hypothetical protein
MKVWRRAQRLAGAGGCATLALGLTGAASAVPAPAQARVTGTTTDPAGPVQVTGLANATQVAAGDRFSLAVHTVLGLPGS